METLGKHKEHEGKEKERKEEESIAKEGDQKDKEKECYPGDAGERQEKHEGKDAKEGEDEQALPDTPGKEGKIEHPKNNESKEVDAIDIRVAKGAKDAEDGDILVSKTDMKYKLIETKEDWEDARDKECQKEAAELILGPDGGIGEKAENKEVKDAEQFLESGRWCDAIGEGKTAPEKDEEEGEVEWEASQEPALEKEDKDPESGDTDADQL